MSPPLELIDMFVPVGLAYDRVLEDRVLVAAGQAGQRKFRAGVGAILRFAAANLWRRLRGRFKGFGTAAVGFGPPISLKAFMTANPQAATEALGAHLMAEIEKVVPVLPVPLVAAVARLQTLPPSPEGVSLEARLAVNGVSSVTPTGVSATATGRSLTAPTLRVTVAVEVLPSASVMV